MKRFVVLAALLSVFTLGSLVAAATVSPFSVFYNLMGVSITPVDVLEVGTSDSPGISPMALSRGPGLNRYGLNNGFSANGWNMPDPSLDGALDYGAYFEFGLRIESGYTASLATLDLSFRRSAKNAPMNFALYVSLNGFDTPGMLVTQWEYHGRTSGTAPGTNPLLQAPYYYMTNDLAGRPNATSSPGDPIPTIALDGPDVLQNLPGGTEVTFRVYAWGNGSTAATNTTALGRVNGPRIEGTVTAN